ncbi:MAG: DUF1080 domain-containing protein [Bacteroidia bacterium]|nr:DUF1080 domain-containing protein [Bacteroidia bacterium]
MLRLLILIAICSLGFSGLYGQDWKRDKQDPRATELWEPVPPKVTPGEGTAAPSDAIVLFDGSSLDGWETTNGKAAGWSLEDGAMTVKRGTGSIRTKQGFGSCQLHIEWRSPTEIVGEGQGRGNSGVFLMSTYEVQVLDSYESRTYSNGQAGSVYKQFIPLVNATKAPGEWQTYDIIFMAPIFNEKGAVIRPASVTVLHNGVLVQNHSVLRGHTPYKGLPAYTKHADKLPIMLQDHGNPVSYRNIWIREL